MATLDALPSAGGAMDAERVYIPIQPEQLQALRRTTGAKVWERDIESAWPPVLLNDALFVAASDEIHALDPATGSERWRVSYDHPMIAPLTAGTKSFKKDPQSTVMHLDVLIAVLEKGEVVAFAADDGRTLWTQQLGSATHYAPATDSNNAVFALDDSRVVALNLADGSRTWELALPGKLNQPTISRDRLFVGSDKNYLYALDNASGRLTWNWRAGGDVLGVSVDANGGGAYYASLDNVLRAVNQSNGNQRWIKEVPTRPLLPPMTFGDGAAYEDVVVLTGVTSEIDAFGVKKGAPAGMYMPPADLQGAPLIDSRLKPYGVSMVVITRDGRAFGLRPTAMMLPEPPVTPLSELPGHKLDRDRIAPAPATNATKTN